MSDYLDKVRLLVAKREDEDWPLVIAAMPESTWEVIPPEDWDKWKREASERMFDDDWTAYDYIEVVAEIPNATLAKMFEAREIQVSAVEDRTDDSRAAHTQECDDHTFCHHAATGGDADCICGVDRQ